MRRHRLARFLGRGGIIGLILIGVGACGSTPNRSPKPEKTVFEGIQIELNETIDDEVVEHVTDRNDDDRTKFVDIDSRLRLSFTSQQTNGRIEASPEWQELENAVSIFRNLQVRYFALVKRAAAMPEFAVEGTDSLQQDLREFRAELFFALNEFVEAGIATADEITEITMAAGVSDEVNPYDEIVRLINGRQEMLRQRINSELALGSQYEVTVRGTIDPQVGTRQQIQIPGYFTIDDRTGSLESQNVKRAAQFSKLKAEYRAAQDLAASVREIQENKDQIEDELETFLRTVADQLETSARNLQQMLQTWPDDLESLVEDAEDGVAANLKSSLERLQADIELSRRVLKGVEELVVEVESLDARALLKLRSSSDTFDKFKQVKQDIADLRQRIAGSDAEPGWDDLVGSVISDIGNLSAAALSNEARASLGQLQASVQSGFANTRIELGRMLPQTEAVIGRLVETFAGNGQFLVAVDDLVPATGTEIPHRFGGDLPDAVVDLGRSPLTHGDDFTLSVRIWPLEGPGDTRAPDAVPVETFEYTFDAINEGWVWSGDLVFTKPEDDEFGDKFEANASVSREWRFYDRRERSNSVNWWRPGLGFHAVQLNQDPDQSAEVGIGINASLWNGLLRIGYGYNLSIEDTPRYYYIGFGVISALNQISDLSDFRD